jgi:2-haloacid dehalogenase
MTYSTILFDADGTLFDYDQAEISALRSAFESRDLPFSAEIHEIYRKINKAKWLDFERGKITKQQLQTERFSDLFEAIGIAVTDVAGFNAGYLDFLAKSAQLIDGAEAVCRVLSADKRLAIVTNGIARSQLGRFHGSAIRPYITDIFISEIIGFQKPDVRYFDHVFQGNEYNGQGGCADGRGFADCGHSGRHKLRGGYLPV